MHDAFFSYMRVRVFAEFVSAPSSPAALTTDQPWATARWWLCFAPTPIGMANALSPVEERECMSVNNRLFEAGRPRQEEGTEMLRIIGLALVVVSMIVFA